MTTRVFLADFFRRKLMTATLTIAVAKARFRTASMAMESGSVAISDPIDADLFGRIPEDCSLVLHVLP